MSYDIVYAREFLRTSDDRIIPLVLIGCNNVWTTNYDGVSRRERSWNTMCVSFNNNIAFSPEELMERAEVLTGGEYQEHFMRNGKWVDDDAFIRFFKNGIKSAKTLDELQNECMCDTVLQASFSVWIGNRNTYESAGNIRSDNELITFLERADNRIANKREGERIFVCLSFRRDDPLPRPKKAKQAKIPLDEFYALESERGYVSRLTKAGLYSTGSLSRAKQFATKKDAERWLIQRDIKLRFRLDFKVIKVKENAPIAA